METKKEGNHSFIRNMMIEVVIYASLLIIYFLIVLRFLGDWLYGLFNSNMSVYTAVGLGILVVQAVALESLTSFLMNFLKLE